MKIDQRLYTQFIYKYKSGNEVLAIEKRSAGISLDSCFYMQDFSEKSNEEMLKELNAVMAAERTRYYCEGDSKYYFNLFKTNTQQYIGILSVLTSLFREDASLINSLTKALFNEYYDEAEQWGKSELDSPKSAAAFWNNVFADVNPDDFTYIPRAGENFAMETFIADAGFSKRFMEYTESGNDPAVLCETAVGAFAAKLDKKERLMLSMCTNGRTLPGAPVIFEKHGTKAEEFEAVKKINEAIAGNSSCTRNDLYRVIGNRFISRIGATVYYSSENTFSTLFMGMRTGKLCCQPSIDTMEAPLVVFFRFFNESLSVTFLYDTDALGQVDMGKVHSLLSGTILSYIDKDKIESADETIDADAVIASDKNNDAAVVNKGAEASGGENTGLSRTDSIKLRLIKSHPISTGLTDEEALDFSRMFGVVTKNMRQSFVSEKEKLNRLYIICSGRIEVLGRNNDYTYNPLYIAKPGEVFGIESFTDDPVSPATYTAMTDNVIALYVSAEDFAVVCKDHPQMLKYLMTQQAALLHRFQKLWLSV